MDKECTDTCDHFMFSCFEYDYEYYFDKDFISPYNGNDSPLEANIEFEEFEFSIWPNIKLGDGHVSPADDLFYRGQLLPLNLPPRLEMLRNLSSSKELEGETDGFDIFSLGSMDSTRDLVVARSLGAGLLKLRRKTTSSPWFNLPPN